MKDFLLHDEHEYAQHHLKYLLVFDAIATDFTVLITRIEIIIRRNTLMYRKNPPQHILYFGQCNSRRNCLHE
jgi:hypothetical protein